MHRRHRSMVAALAAALALGLVSSATGAAAAAGGGDRSLATTAHPPSSTHIQDVDEPITFAEAYELVAQLAADFQITRLGEDHLRIYLLIAERFYRDGEGCSHELRREYFFVYLDRFENIASDPRYVLTQSAQDQLLAAADQLKQLCGGPEAR